MKRVFALAFFFLLSCGTTETTESVVCPDGFKWDDGQGACVVDLDDPVLTCGDIADVVVMFIDSATGLPITVDRFDIVRESGEIERAEQLINRPTEYRLHGVVLCGVYAVTVIAEGYRSIVTGEFLPVSVFERIELERLQ